VSSKKLEEMKKSLIRESNWVKLNVRGFEKSSIKRREKLS